MIIDSTLDFLNENYEYESFDKTLINPVALKEEAESEYLAFLESSLEAENSLGELGLVLDRTLMEGFEEFKLDMCVLEHAEYRVKHNLEKGFILKEDEISNPAAQAQTAQASVNPQNISYLQKIKNFFKNLWRKFLALFGKAVEYKNSVLFVKYKETGIKYLNLLKNIQGATIPAFIFLTYVDPNLLKNGPSALINLYAKVDSSVTGLIGEMRALKTPGREKGLAISFKRFFSPESPDSWNNRLIASSRTKIDKFGKQYSPEITDESGYVASSSGRNAGIIFYEAFRKELNIPDDMATQNGIKFDNSSITIKLVINAISELIGLQDRIRQIEEDIRNKVNSINIDQIIDQSVGIKNNATNAEDTRNEMRDILEQYRSIISSFQKDVMSIVNTGTTRSLRLLWQHALAIAEQLISRVEMTAGSTGAITGNRENMSQDQIANAQNNGNIEQIPA